MKNLLFYCGEALVSHVVNNHYLRSGGGGGGGGGGLFHLETMMVLVLHIELEYKVGKLKYKTLKVMQPRSKTNPVGQETILDRSTRRFTVEID